jgi:hypothetical protein
MKAQLTRRSLIAGTIGTAATAFTVKASETKPNPNADRFTALLDAMQATLPHVVAMEVLTDNFAPHYRKGDLIFVKPETAKASDHVWLKLKGGKAVFGELVHSDAKAIYVRGFKKGDRMAVYPVASVTTWGRIVISYRA